MAMAAGVQEFTFTGQEGSERHAGRVQQGGGEESVGIEGYWCERFIEAGAIAGSAWSDASSYVREGKNERRGGGANHG